MVCLRILARAGRADCTRPFASSPSSSGSNYHVDIARGALAKHAQHDRVAVHPKRWNPEAAITLQHIFGAAARYRRATVGSCYDGAYPDSSALHTGAIRPHLGFEESLFFISPRTGHGSSKVFEMLPAFSFSSCACVFRKVNGASMLLSGPVEAEKR
jgi:hypothetical protein